MSRQDTRLESEGAEFLVLGQFLIHKIAAYKTYTNMPGYDLVATNPDQNTSAKIQVGYSSRRIPNKKFRMRLCCGGFAKSRLKRWERRGFAARVFCDSGRCRQIRT